MKIIHYYSKLFTSLLILGRRGVPRRGHGRRFSLGGRLRPGEEVLQGVQRGQDGCRRRSARRVHALVERFDIEAYSDSSSK